MVLSGDELARFRQFQQTGSVAPTGVSGMVQNVFSPFTKFSNQLGQGVTNISSGLGLSERGDYMSQKEIENWKSNPIMETAKPIAGMAAWSVEAFAFLAEHTVHMDQIVFVDSCSCKLK